MPEHTMMGGMMASEQPEDAMSYTGLGMADVSLLEGDESEGLIGSSESRERNSEPLSWRHRLEGLKQQASAKFDSLMQPRNESASQSSNEVTTQAIQKAVDDTISRLTDPMYTEIDFEQALTFVDDIKSWSVAIPAVLPLVVSRVEKRMHTGHPKITLLNLSLIDFLVKNASILQFHQQVATTLTGTIVSIAKGSLQQQSMSNYLQRLSDAVPAELKGQQARTHTQTSSERAASARSAQLKAKELIKTWGEGLPLFAETLRCLVQEGVDFSDVEVHGPVALESTDLQARFALDEEADQSVASSSEVGGANGADFSSVIMGAYDAAKLVAEVRRGGEDDGSLLQVMEAECQAQQQELSSIIEVCLSTGDEATLLSAIAANEALQEAVNGKSKQAEEHQDEKQDEKQDPNTVSPDDLLSNTNTSSASGGTCTDNCSNTANTANAAIDLLGLDFLCAPLEQPVQQARPAPFPAAVATTASVASSHPVLPDL
jgi:hypothetical protein